MSAVHDIADLVPVRQACHIFGIGHATYYRALKPQQSTASRYPPPANKLTPQQRQQILDLLVDPDHVDKTPYTLYYHLLDQGTYLCSVRTMYRLLNEQGWLKQRRESLRRPPALRPQLVARGPNEVWSWDISNIKGPAKGLFFKLYVVIDLFSRAVVGWCISGTESGEQARGLVEQSCLRHGIHPDQLTLHSDRGAAMVSAPLRELLEKLDVHHSFARPYTPNDNPYSEAHFRTVKDHPSFPESFGCQEDAVKFFRVFFEWYNHRHYHSGIAFLPPAVVHTGQQGPWLARRQRTLDAAYAAHPERFSSPPCPPQLPEEAVGESCGVDGFGGDFERGACHADRPLWRRSRGHRPPRRGPRGRDLRGPSQKGTTRPIYPSMAREVRRWRLRLMEPETGASGNWKRKGCPSVPG